MKQSFKMAAGRLALAVAFVLTLQPTILEAEVSVRGNSTSASADRTIMMAISEGPDPIDSKIWKPYTNVSTANVLNPSGELRGDSAPCVTWYPTSKRPAAVWAYRSGLDFDIAFSEWTGSAWTPTLLLAQTSSREQDPRVFITDDGSIHVVWWVVGAKDRVMLRSRPSTSSSWSSPQEITAPGESGRRPTVVVHSGQLWVAYERDAIVSNFQQEIIAAEWTGQTVGSTVLVAWTDRSQRLDPVLHTQGARLWIDWKDGDDAAAFAEYDSGSWSSPSAEQWNDPTWVGVEAVRATIRTRVLSGGPPPTP